MSKGLRFEWDSSKALANKTKHGVSFEEAANVFADVMSITIMDPDHSGDDDYREITIGMTGKQRIIVVGLYIKVGL